MQLSAERATEGSPSRTRIGAGECEAERLTLLEIGEIIRMWRVQPYAGEDSAEAMRFVEEVQNGHQAMPIPEEDLLAHLPRLLTGQARIWYRNHRDLCDTWEHFAAALLERFADPARDRQLRGEAMSRRQRSPNGGCLPCDGEARDIRERVPRDRSRERLRDRDGQSSRRESTSQQRPGACEGCSPKIETLLRALTSYLDRMEGREQRVARTPRPRQRDKRTRETARTRQGPGPCWACRRKGHFARECPCAAYRPGQGSPPAEGKGGAGDRERVSASAPGETPRESRRGSVREDGGHRHPRHQVVETPRYTTCL